MLETNFLIIGSGAAGLTFAVKIAEEFPDKTVVIVTKADEHESNTKYAQGGVAVVIDSESDSFQKHIQDTLKAGDGLCDETIVEMVIKEGPERLRELVLWGTNFDTNTTGKLNLGKEGGHSEHRVIHHKDITGYEIERALVKRVHKLHNILVLQHHFAIDLITEHHLEKLIPNPISCYGAYVLDQKSEAIITIKADRTLLATGGIGRVYGHTTNPVIATGDGIAMAYRSRAQIKDMEFVQFHPTALYDSDRGSSFLISEAVRGFGAYLRTKKGRRFMLDYDERAELASRDIVSQSIDNELKKSGESCVYLDCTHLDIESFKKHFPNIYKKCISKKIDITKDWIPVLPAAHYLCGGIAVDNYGRTSIMNLFACGECTRTGLHGANRLASNSLLEALVYAHNIFKYQCKFPSKSNQVIPPMWNDQGTSIPKELVLVQHNLKQLQALMRDYVGIVRTNDRLNRAVEHLDLIYREVEELYNKSKINTTLCELRNMVNVAHLIINQSLRRKENKGGFYNSDNVKNNSIPMRTLIKESIAKAVTYQDYNSMVKLLVAEKRTSGIEHTQEKIEFTKLNASRSKRLDKTINLSEKELAHFKNIGVSQTWLVLTETWCGDAAHTLPILNKIAEASPKIDLKIVFRDENETLMNAFLTNGTKSVPKLVILDDNYNVLASWGPRSRAATQMVETYKLRHGKLGDNFKKDLQVWYNKDQGQSLLKDLISLTLKAPIFSNILEPIS